MEREFVVELMRPVTQRSMQKSIGPSQIGGCRRKVWMQINGFLKTNPDTVRGSAWLGTAIHKALENGVRAQDPFAERYLLEVRVEHAGLTGHVDVYDKVDFEVIDWKTTTKAKLKQWPNEQQWMQVQLYGYLLRANGYPVEVVSLVGIPRDGDERHIAYEWDTYKEEVAQQGLLWLAELHATQEPPMPEMPVRFCKDYCGFYDASETVGCGGKGA